MCFNGALADHIDIGNQVKPPFPFTITAWVKPDTVDRNMAIIMNDLWRYLYSGAIVAIFGTTLFGGYDDGGWHSSDNRTNTSTEQGVVVAGDWQQVAVVFNAHRDIRLYHNCIEYPITGYDGTGDTMRYGSPNGTIGLGSPIAGYPFTPLG